MAHEDLIETLKASWQSSAVDIDRARRRAMRGLVLNRFLFAIHFAGALTATVFAVLLAWKAWATGNALFGLSAAGLLVALPLILAEQLKLGKQGGSADLGTPQVVLCERRAQVETALRLLRGCHVAALILLGCLAGAWVLVVLGRAPSDSGLYLTAVWGGTAALTLALASWRRARMTAELHEIDRLITLFDETGSSESG